MGSRLPLALALCFSAMLSRSAFAADASPASRCVAVVGTNDVHGVIEPMTINSPQGQSVQSGGVVGMSAYVTALRAVYGKRLVLLDGGDLFQGTMASNLSGGKAIIEAYNLMGYTASAVGNHEFDFGAAQDNAADKLGIIKARIAQAKFPFLTLNVFDRQNGQRVAWPNTTPSILADFGGVKVGILGVSTPETPKVTRPINVSPLLFKEPKTLVLNEARALRQRGAELVVLVGHIGGKCTSLKDPNDPSSCDLDRRDAELLQLMQALPAGTVDVAIGGHTHQFIGHWINGAATLESGSRGQHFGWVEACLDDKGAFDRNRSRVHSAENICLSVWNDDGACHRRKTAAQAMPARFLEQTITPMPQVVSAMKPYVDAVAAIAQKPIGVRMPTMTPTQTLTGMVAESMRRAMHADFGLQNRGGIRAELPAGPINYGQIFAVLPFDNAVVKVTMTGQQLADLYDLTGRYRQNGGPTFSGLGSCPSDSGASTGLDAAAVGLQSICDAKGAALDPNARYSLATSDFLVEGGDGADRVFKYVPDSDRQVSDLMMREAFIDLLTAMHPG